MESIHIWEGKFLSWDRGWKLSDVFVAFSNDWNIFEIFLESGSFTKKDRVPTE